MQKRRVNVRGIVWRDGKILAVKHKRSDGSPAEYWAIPGGGLDLMETLEQGVKREIFEELGVEATVNRLALVQQFLSKRDGFDEELEFHFIIDDAPGFDSINLESTSHGAEEIYEVAFIDPKTEPILPEILTNLDIAGIVKGLQSTVVYVDPKFTRE